MTTLTISPRHGRDYKSKAEVEEDFSKGVDFTVEDMFSRWAGMACNKQDLIDQGVTVARVRYAKKTKVHNINLKA